MFPWQCYSVSFSWLVNVISTDWVIERKLKPLDALGRLEKQSLAYDDFFHLLLYFISTVLLHLTLFYLYMY